MDLYTVGKDIGNLQAQMAALQAQSKGCGCEDSRVAIFDGVKNYKNAHGELLIGYEERGNDFICFFRNEADVASLVERLNYWKISALDGKEFQAEYFLKSNCGSVGGGRCSGSCSTPYGYCRGLTHATKEGLIFFCGC